MSSYRVVPRRAPHIVLVHTAPLLSTASNTARCCCRTGSNTAPLLSYCVEHSTVVVVLRRAQHRCHRTASNTAPLSLYLVEHSTVVVVPRRTPHRCRRTALNTAPLSSYRVEHRTVVITSSDCARTLLRTATVDVVTSRKLSQTARCRTPHDWHSASLSLKDRCCRLTWSVSCTLADELR